MTDKKRPPRDIWKQPPGGSEGDAAKDFERPRARPAESREPNATPPEQADSHQEEVSEYAGTSETQDGEAGYVPRHRAPGRAPLIRRKRSRVGEEEEVSWETSWSNEPPSRWTTEEEPSISPPPKPIEDLPYLGPRRSEQRRRRPKPGDEAATENVRRSRDYTGRHLAPKKPARWARSEEDAAERTPEPVDDYIEFQDRDLVGGAAPEPSGLVEGDASEPEPAASEAAAAEAASPPPTEETAADETETQPRATAPEPQAEAETEAESGIVRSTRPEAGSPTAETEVSPARVVEQAEPEPEETAEEDTTPAIAPEVLAPAETAMAAPDAPVPVLPEAPPAPAPAAPPETEEEESTAAETLVPEVSTVAEDDDDPVDEEELFDEDGEPILDDDGVPAGPRRAALLERKKKKRVRQTVGTVAAVLAAAAAIGGTGVLVRNVVDPEEKVAVPVGQPAPAPELGGTTLLFGTKESSDQGRGAIWMTLVTYDPESEKASVVYVPPHTAVEVPGRGLQGVGEAYGSGGVPLLLVSAENLLGIKIDRYLELSDKDALVLFEKLEPLTVDVPAEVRVPVGKDEARLIFVEGPQELTPPLLVKLLYIVGIDGDDVELGGRHLAFWQQFLEVHEPDEVAAAIQGASAALGESDASAKELAEFFAAVAALPPEDVRLSALPVRPISAGESELYATDGEELAAFVEDTIGVDPDAPDEVRIQLLNGNGVPGLGREVADLLVGEGFRVILGGNARRLNYRKTLIISYDSSDEAIATAERARDLLGVGEVQVSAQQQGIVDLTIVVGKDFLRAQ